METQEPGMPAPFADRRKQRRREEDVAEHEIVERAIHEAPLVSRLLQTGKVATAAIAFGTIVGCAGAFIGIRLTGPRDAVEKIRRDAEIRDSLLGMRIDSNVARIAAIQVGQQDVIAGVRGLQQQLELQAYTQCILVRRMAPDIRPKGCDAVIERGGTR